MEVKLDSGRPAALAVDCLVVAASAHGNAVAVKELDQVLQGKLAAELAQQHFQGKDGEVAVFQTHGALPTRNVVVVGIGDGRSAQSWYRLAHQTVTRAHDLGARTAGIVLPNSYLLPNTVEPLTEGIALSTYTFDQLKTTQSRTTPRLETVTIVTGRRADATLARSVDRALRVAMATRYARDLVNFPAATVTPAYLASEARRIARAQHLKARIWNRKALARAGMGALLGVSQGSSQAPYFIELVYEPTTNRGRSTKGAASDGTWKRIALAGKGITFDSGGLSIKPAESMQTQKRDMAGGAAVLAAMSALRDLQVRVEVRAYIPATENMPGGRAIKPGDVVRAYNGKTIEVLNTDAEGRLVLADALAYATTAKPDVIIDLATLTAAVRMALGSRYAAIMGTDATLVERLIAAGRECGENLWELPLVAEYRSDIDSSVADIKNVGEGGAGTIIGGLFLREFVGTIPWAHIDFSSTVVTDKPLPCHPRGATGFGVRTLLRFLQRL